MDKWRYLWIGDFGPEALLTRCSEMPLSSHYPFHPHLQASLTSEKGGPISQVPQRGSSIHNTHTLTGFSETLHLPFVKQIPVIPQDLWKLLCPQSTESTQKPDEASKVLLMGKV